MITVLGASGFVGSNLIDLLALKKLSYYAPSREESLSGKFLGDVIYCIGMTADFRTRPFDTVEAHVCKLKYLLKDCEFNSLTYLSSTRLYLKSPAQASRLTEDVTICLDAGDPFDLFAASKITGELLALNCGRPNVKIIRLSNVFGSDLTSENFITSIVRDAVKNGKVELQTTPDSEKDYIAVEDVCEALLRLSKVQGSGIYNLAFGRNTTNKLIVDKIRSITGAEMVYSSSAKKISFTEIDNTKLGNVIDFFPARSILDALPEIIKRFTATI